MKIILIGFLVLLPLFHADESAKRDFIPVGPQNISIADYPFQASVIRYDYSYRLCGAVIVGPLSVITTANCIRMEGSSGLRVRVGSPSRRFHGVLYEVKSLAFHTRPLKPTAWVHDLDIGIIRLKTPINFGVNVQPVAMVPEKGDQQESIAFLLGWEWMGPTVNTKEDENFQKVRLAIVDREICDKLYKKSFNVTENMICAGGSPRSVLRQNRAYGGALINSKKQLIGILSYTDEEHKLGYPYVFTRIGSPGVQTFIKKYNSL